MRGILTTKLLYIVTSCLLAGTAAHSQCLPKGWKPLLPGRVLILHPRVEIRTFKILLKSNDSEGTADAVSSELLGTVAQAFEDRKYNLVVEPPLMDDWEKDPSNSQAISVLDDQYDQQMSGTPTCEGRLMLTFDQYVKAMPNHKETDLLVVIRGIGMVLTKGGKATSVLGLGYGPADSLTFSLGIIDGSTGHVVYSCDGYSEGGGYINKPSKLSDSVDKCLQMFFVGQPKHSWRDLRKIIVP